MSNFRYKVKKALIDKLTINGFKRYHNLFERSMRGSRGMVQIKMNDTNFECIIRYYPLKEGWSIETRAYTYKNVDELWLP